MLGKELRQRCFVVGLVVGGLVCAEAPAETPAGRRVPLKSAITSIGPSAERDLIETDWRKQDGIGTPRMARSYREATELTIRRGDDLLADLATDGVDVAESSAAWRAVRTEWQALSENAAAPEAAWESLWRRVHLLRRRIVFANPLAPTGPLVFLKRVPSSFSHQLTQYYGRHARPGGGLFVLQEPGRSFACRQLAAELPLGSYLHPEVSHDGRRILFAYCQVDEVPPDRDAHGDVFYHLYAVNSDGSGLRQLTDGPFDDFSPCELPNRKLMFVSTRRGGFHRCGRGPCPTYTLALAEADGSNPHSVSYHETNEWDPSVMHDGRVIYTRWDYVDRDAVFYQQLWSVRPDGTAVRSYYGNNTWNPVGVWEARAVPGSEQIMATAAAHHAMTAGSIILVDTRRGTDGLEPITRLTPDVPFPESEATVVQEKGGRWHAPAGVVGAPPAPIEAARWPGHCYRSPWPLSEKYFLAAYSFVHLIGEPTANHPNMFGIYLVDRFGNKELLYRDPEISSLWPIPLKARKRAEQVPSIAEGEGKKGTGTFCAKHPPGRSGKMYLSPFSREGTFFMHNVYTAWPRLPEDSVKRLRIVQVLPKTTPNVNNPMLGLANASPGKQVLGTVPVEADGSAHFRAPAGVPLAFQALDELGRAVQIMRSVTYLQPGERMGCVGCHEPTATAPTVRTMATALLRSPSVIAPGPDGSRPLSYPLLVQPVLDAQCVRCHNREKAEGKVVLTGEPAGHYTASFNSLAPLVSYASWGRRPNSEPATKPGFFGARGSRLMKLLLDRHHDVELSAEEIERLATWMDANALFYGTFDPADQARQQRGERIAGPAIE